MQAISVTGLLLPCIGLFPHPPPTHTLLSLRVFPPNLVRCRLQLSLISPSLTHSLHTHSFPNSGLFFSYRNYWSSQTLVQDKERELECCYAFQDLAESRLPLIV